MLHHQNSGLKPAHVIRLERLDAQRQTREEGAVTERWRSLEGDRWPVEPDTGTSYTPDAGKISTNIFSSIKKSSVFSKPTKKEI